MADDEEQAPARKIFVHNCGEFVGSNIAKKFSSSTDDNFEVIGTLRSPSDAKPRWVSRVVDPSSTEALRAAFLESELTVLDCLGQMDVAEAILASIGGAQWEDEKVLVGVSSVMTWTRTTPDADEPEKPLTEAEYKRRRPHSSFKELHALEKLVTKSKRAGLRTHVVGAGLTYGAEEDLFHRLFKAAWHGKAVPLLSVADGANVPPTVHIADLCTIVTKLLEGDSEPYILAVDAGQQQEEAGTLKAIVTALSASLGTGAVEEVTKEAVLLERDYEFFQAAVKLAPEAANGLVGEWHSAEGILANLPTVIAEFREARNLMPLKVLVHGNDDLAKGALAATIATEYKLPLIVAKETLQAAADGDDAELAAEAKAALAAPSDATMAKVVGAALTTVACKNQGYVLVGYPEQKAQAEGLFAMKAEGGEEAAEEEAEEEGAAPKAAAPEFLLVLEAPDDVIKAKLLALPEQTTTEEALAAQLAAYAEHNAEDAPTSLLAITALADNSLALAVGADTAPESLMTKAAVYLGEPRNYGATEEELAAKAALEAEAAAKAAAEEAAVKAAQAKAEAEERARREAHESRRLAELQQQEKELLEVRSLPLRNYLLQNVIPTLTEGLIEVCKVKPDDPIDHLAEWLFQNNPVEEE